jgi:hypothetical protein
MQIELSGKVVEISSESLSTDKRTRVRIKVAGCDCFYDDLKFPNVENLQIDQNVILTISLPPAPIETESRPICGADVSNGT